LIDEVSNTEQPEQTADSDQTMHLATPYEKSFKPPIKY